MHTWNVDIRALLSASNNFEKVQTVLSINGDILFLISISQTKDLRATSHILVYVNSVVKCINCMALCSGPALGRIQG